MEAVKAFGEFSQALTEMSERLDQLENWKKTVEAYPDLPYVLTAKDISAFMQVSEPQGYVYIRQMRHFGGGKLVRATRVAFLEWLTSREVSPGQEDTV